MMKCDSCVHANTCKYRDGFIECVTTIEKLNRLEFMKVSFDCKYYSESNLMPKELDLPNFTTISTNNRKECSNCEFYNRYIVKGQTYIGDAPCQWCQKYPFTITYKENSSDSPYYINKKEE